MSSSPVVIIGAGLAGLQAARLLATAQVPFIVLEARDRPGGRILTVGDDARPAADGFDLGPSWFWPRAQPQMAELVATLQLPVLEQHSRGDVLIERMSREGPRRYQSGEQESLSFRVAGGSAALVHALARLLPADSIRLEHRVTSMEQAHDGLRLAIHSPHGDSSLHASHVIAALPPRLLEHTVAFSPALDASTARRWRGTPTWMAPHAKFFAVYDRAFWREAGLSGTAQSMVGPMPEIHDATTASGRPALFGFVGVGADQRALLGDEALTRTCLAQLVRLFGSAAQHPRATLVKDWAADPLTATPDDRIPGGHPVVSGEAWVDAAWRDRLTLGGSEVSHSEPGYLAGAVVAGAMAAERVLELRARDARERRVG